MNGMAKRSTDGNPSTGKDYYSRSGTRGSSTMEGSSQIQSRESRTYVETHWYDWLNPKWREKTLKKELDEALKDLTL